MVYSGNRDGGGGVLHFNNNKKQVNKLLCVAIKLKHLGNFYLTAWMVHDYIFINSNFFWNLKNFGDTVQSAPYCPVSKKIEILFQFYIGEWLFKIHNIALCILNPFKRK